MHVFLCKSLFDNKVSLLNVFNILRHEIYWKNDKKLHRNVKNGKIMQYLHLLGSSLGHSGIFGVNQKFPKISTKTYRVILILRQSNSIGETLSLDINLVLSKFCKKKENKKPVSTVFFLFHMKYGRKIKHWDLILVQSSWSWTFIFMPIKSSG